MSVYIIQGKNRVTGTLAVHGAKNAVLPILAAAAICGDCVLNNCPDLTDVTVAMEILGHLGCSARREGSTIITTAGGGGDWRIPDDLMKAMRSSVVFLGGMIARHGEGEISLPGGCELGSRPVDLHLFALEQLGAQIQEEGGKLRCTAPHGLHGADIRFPFPSVGATENAIIAAVTAKGDTQIIGGAKEPEIASLIAFLQACGAKIQVTIDGTICIQGVERLHGCTYTVIADRIAAGTYLCAAAATGGEIQLTNLDPAHILTALAYLSNAGCVVRTTMNSVWLRAPDRMKELGIIKTQPYPGFPTDMQAVMMATALGARGTSVFVENIFDSRLRHVEELQKLGADIVTQGKIAVVTGVQRLHGAHLTCTDLRGGAAMVLGAIAAEGTSTVGELAHIDRGYERFAENLASLGVKITKEKQKSDEKAG